MADCSIEEVKSWPSNGLYFQTGCHHGLFNISANHHPWRDQLVELEACNGMLKYLPKGSESADQQDMEWNSTVYHPTYDYEGCARLEDDSESIGSLIPGLPDDIAKMCMSLVPRSDLPAMGRVNKSWMSFLQSKEFHVIRKISHMQQEWLYGLTHENRVMQWHVYDQESKEWSELPPMPHPERSGSGFTVIDGKLLVIGGLINKTEVVADVVLYDSALNRWIKVSNMHKPRYEFACAVLDGLVYVVGGHSLCGQNLSDVEVYNPETNQWTVLPSLKRARWGCIAWGLEGKLYVMSGRSSFTIGHSRSVDVFDPVTGRWQETKNGCMMVLTHAKVDQDLFCIEWKDGRKLAIFNAVQNSWKRVALPVAGSLNVGFCLVNVGGKLLFLSTEIGAHCGSFLYDPRASDGAEWLTAEIKPLAACVHATTITA